MVQSQQPLSLTIGKLAEAGGVGVETVRFYQRKGLLRTPEKAEGFRHYAEDDLRRLRFIRQAQTAGFTLQEINELLALNAGEDRARARALAEARVAALDARIAELSEARAALARLATECAGNHKGPCPILTAFEA